MRNQLTDLLPRSRRKALAREYRYRLATVAISTFIALIFTAAALLLPTYVFLTRSIAAKQARLTGIQSTLASNDEVAISARLAALSSDAKELSALAAQPSPSKILQEMLAIPHPYVPIVGFSYKPAQGKSPATLSITGVAASRNALRAYQIALQDAPFVVSADLPVSAYAKDTDISFIITLSLKS